MIVQTASLEIPSHDAAVVEAKHKLPTPATNGSAFSWKSGVHPTQAAEHVIFGSPGLTSPSPAAEQPRGATNESLSLRIYVVMFVVALLTFGCLVVAYDLMAGHSPIVSG